MASNHMDLLIHKRAFTTKYADTTTVNTWTQKRVKCHKMDQSHHFSLLLLLVLQLHGHQPMVELGDLSPHHLDLVVHCQSLHALRPQGGVGVHAVAALDPGLADRGPDGDVSVLGSAGGGVIAHLAQLYGSEMISVRRLQT